MHMEFSDDVLINIFEFFPRRKLCQLELFSSEWHYLLNFIKILHIVRTQLFLLPVSSSNCCSSNQMQFAYFVQNVDQAKRRRLPDPPHFIRCLRIEINTIDLSILAFLQQTGHIFQHSNIAEKELESSVEIIVNIETNSRIWPELFSIFHAMNFLNFYLTKDLPAPVRKILHQRDDQLKQLKDQMHSGQLQYDNYLAQCTFSLENARTQIYCQLATGKNEMSSEEMLFGPSVEEMFAWLHCECGKQGFYRKIIFFDEAITDLMPKKIRQLVQKNFEAFQRMNKMNEEEIATKKQRSIIIRAFSNRVRELIENTSLENMVDVGFDHRNVLRIDNPASGQQCRIKVQEFSYGLCGQLVMVQDQGPPIIDLKEFRGMFA